MSLEASPGHPEQLDHLQRVIKGEFNEMPGMHLTRSQIKRLWSLTDDDCQEVVGRLVAQEFLTLRPDDQYCRRIDTA
jgi:hypothetical protein